MGLQEIPYEASIFVNFVNELDVDSKQTGFVLDNQIVRHLSSVLLNLCLSFYVACMYLFFKYTVFIHNSIYYNIMSKITASKIQNGGRPCFNNPQFATSRPMFKTSLPNLVMGAEPSLHEKYFESAQKTAQLTLLNTTN